MTTEIIDTRSQIVLTPVTPQMDIATQINHLHEECRLAAAYAKINAIRIGMLLLMVRSERQRSGDYKDWLKANCRFSVRTAYNYTNLVEKSFAENTLQKLLEGTDEDRRVAAETFSDANPKALTDLYHECGIVGKSTIGGKREGSGRKKVKSAAQLAAAAQAAAENLAGEQLVEKVGEVYVLAVTQGAAGGLATERIKELVGSLDAVVRTLRDIVKSRKE